MLAVNLHTLNFVRSTNEPHKLLLIDESTGDPAYFRLKIQEGNDTTIELYHAPSLAPLGVFQNISSTSKLISLTNPASTIELTNPGHTNFEWTFCFDQGFKFCWKKDIFGLAGSKRGFTCWMSRKPDPDFPCAIYKPGTSSVLPFCQFLDFNIGRIDGLQDPRGLKYVIVLSLLGFTEAEDDEEHRPEPPLPSQNKVASPTTLKAPPEAHELRVSGHRSTPELVTQGLKLFEDPLLSYLSVYASSPKDFKQATNVAEQIRRDRLNKSGEELLQYLVDDTTRQEISGASTAPLSSATSKSSSNSLRLYLSRTPLNELFPKSTAKINLDKPTKSLLTDKSTKSSLLAPATTRLSKAIHRPQIPIDEKRQSLPASFSSPSSTANSLHSRLMTGVHRPFSKIMSITSNSSRPDPLYQYQNLITPYYYLDEKDETSSEVMQVQDEKAQDPIEPTAPLRLSRDPPGDSEKQTAPVINYLQPSHEILLKKKPQPFVICSNELNATSQAIQKNRVLVKNRNHNNPKEGGTRENPFRLNLSGNEKRQSSEGDHGNSLAVSSSSESIRSRSSTIKSTASSFVEIILSSCCSAYSSAFNGSKVPSENSTTPKPKSHLRRTHQSPTTSTWKRLSHIGGRHSMVSNLFSSKLDPN